MDKKLTYEELESKIEILQKRINNYKQEGYYRVLMENSSDAISIFDKTGKSIFRSDSYELIMGYKIGEMLEKNVFDLVYEDDRKKLMKQLSNSLNNPKKVDLISFRAYHKDGTLRYLEGTGKNMLDCEQIKGVVVNYRDVTKRIRIEQRLQEKEQQLIESNKAKDKLFSIIAHDLKNPFNSIIGFSNLLCENYDKFNIEKQKEIIKIIKDSSQEAYKLLENLLLWSCTQQGIISYIPENTNLYLIANEEIEFVAHSLQNKKISIKNKISKNISVNVDRNMVLTVFRNLLSNAIKFTKRDGEISLYSDLIISNNRKFVKVTVKDNGIGISNKSINKLFKISENISTRGTEEEKGTGIGLMICKDFIEKHEGEIWVESKPDEGSSFYFTLPVV